MRFDKVNRNQFGNSYFHIVKIDTPQYALDTPDGKSQESLKMLTAL